MNSSRARSIPDTVREICLSFPQAQELSSHGKPNFKVEGKSFAMFCINHHGDMRVGLWLHSPPGVQRLYTQANPEAYFVPPYVGPKGWLGVDLNKGLHWNEVANRVREAYENTAPPAFSAGIGETIRVEPPPRDMRPEEINLLLGKRPQEVLAQLAIRCRALPESTEGEQFGSPVWKAGKKTFVCTHHHHGRLKMQFRVGVEQQGFLTSDPRYTIPSYIGHKGWIDLDVEDHVHWSEVESLLDASYRHFALQRMLKALDAG